MGKLKESIKSKLPGKAEHKTEKEKLDKRREEVLAKGRKFKYPLQWTKHRIVVNTILISIVVIALIVVSGWFALYKLNMTDDLLDRFPFDAEASCATLARKSSRSAKSVTSPLTFGFCVFP